MQRLLWAASGAGVDGEIERRLEDYVEILFAWNDRLNTNLSLVGSYFGDEARSYLDGLYEEFKRVGQGVEAVVRAVRVGDSPEEVAARISIDFEGRQAGSLNDRVYQFGLMLMGQLREGQVGRSAPNQSTVRSTI
jgi:hypothetical protein